MRVYGKRRTGNRRSLLSIAACIACLCAVSASAQPSSEGEVASTSVNRGALSPSFLNAFGYGYYTYINGINGSMFAGAPSEQTAYFTFLTSVANTQPLPANIDEAPEISSGAYYNIYLTTNPNHTWTDPNSFATGILVATFRRTDFILSALGFAAYETFNSTLVYSQPFVFNGVTLDFKNITQKLRTSNIFGRLPFPTGSPIYPVNLSFTGYAVATKLGTPVTTNAVAGPQGLSTSTNPITLDGTQSTSSDGQPLTYEWVLSPTSPTGTLTNANTATPTLTFTEDGVYTLSLTVTDDTGYSTTTYLNINYIG